MRYVVNRKLYMGWYFDF